MEGVAPSADRSSVDSLAAMKNALPGLRKRLNTDPVYFKQVYMHTFDLAKPEGARTLPIDTGKSLSYPCSPMALRVVTVRLTGTALGLWNVYIPSALEARPSALSRIPSGDPPNSPSTDIPPEFTKAHFDLWIEFQKKKGKAVSKDTWSLFVDFIRSIDADFKEYDDSGESPFPKHELVKCDSGFDLWLTGQRRGHLQSTTLLIMSERRSRERCGTARHSIMLCWLGNVNNR